jgi:hypothetical protein
LRVTLHAIDSFDAEIATVSQSLPDYALFRALPGAAEWNGLPLLERHRMCQIGNGLKSNR